MDALEVLFTLTGAEGRFVTRGSGFRESTIRARTLSPTASIRGRCSNMSWDTLFTTERTVL